MRVVVLPKGMRMAGVQAKGMCADALLWGWCSSRNPQLGLGSIEQLYHFICIALLSVVSCQITLYHYFCKSIEKRVDCTPSTKNRRCCGLTISRVPDDRAPTLHVMVCRGVLVIVVVVALITLMMTIMTMAMMVIAVTMPMMMMTMTMQCHSTLMPSWQCFASVFLSNEKSCSQTHLRLDNCRIHVLMYLCTALCKMQ